MPLHVSDILPFSEARSQLSRLVDEVQHGAGRRGLAELAAAPSRPQEGLMRIRFTANALANLDAIEAFLTQNDHPQAFDQLLAELQITCCCTW